MPLAKSDHPFRVGDWLVEPALDRISRAGIVEKLEPRAMRLLMCLVSSEGGVVSIERLLTEVWAGVIVGPASVYQAISQLRKLLCDTDPEPTYIATVPRKGYRLVAAIQPVDTPAQSPAVRELSAGAAPRKSRAGRLAEGAIVALLIVGLIAVAWQLLRRQPLPAEATSSIVVLPFADLTAEKQDQPFCDGLTEELSNWLAQIPSLRVVARTSAFSFRGRDADVRTIGKALDTNHVLEGSLRRSGDHIRVLVQLIDARTGYHLWSAAYDRQISDTIRLQEDISRSVAASLKIRLTATTAQRFAGRESDNPQAYQWYLLARHYQQQRTAQSNADAIKLYRQILAADPGFALAYVGLAYALLNDNWLGGRPIAEIAIEAEPLLQAALKLNADLSELYAVRGALRAEQFRIDAALQDLRHAARLNPSDSLAFRELGRLFLLQKGQPRNALLNYTRAAQLDPLDSLPQAQRCVALQDLGQFAEAAAACARARALQPQSYWPLTVTSWLAAAQGKLDEALRWNQLAIEAAPDVFQLYNERSMWFLIVGVPTRAREALQRAQSATNEQDGIAIALAEVAFYEGGPPALQAHLSAARLGASPHSGTLLLAAYYQLLAADVTAARTLAERALKSPDYSAADLGNPWNISRWGHSDELTLALIDMRTGNEAAAASRLGSIAATLDDLVRNGEKRFGVDEVRATVLALRGDPEGAVRSLTRAAELGWRRSWWAQREPDLSTIWTRNDFRALMSRVDQSNSELRARIAQAAH
jgi:TolB-like protein/DNA-binding winged helix-turn-helix (wHTH) protein/tetratricopeptide (TPR) repeat protein